ncbi:ABC transporter ATP-binding protein [Paenibacillus allorhizosphaerae]|uniref:ABC transporter ATP-binding protein n=1 Tax=Paenibacillus allorhizosphaerae TaxID=2849866 RepID=UPI001C4078F3|nr:ABC transporter ATP-binding protein [Paenibacillus allorhizosphaerae]
MTERQKEGIGLERDDRDREWTDEADPKKSRWHYFGVYTWLLSFMKPYAWQMTLFIIFGLVISLSQMGIFRVLQYIIDHIITAKDLEKFRFIVLVLIGVLVCMFGAMAANNLLSRLVREKASRDLQYACMKQLRRLGFAYYEKHGVGETLSLLNTDVSSVQGIYQKHFPSLVNNGLMMFVALGFVVHTNAKLFLVTVPCVFLYYLIGPYFTKKSSYWGKVSKDRRTEWNRKIYESISGLTEMRAHQREAWDLERYEAKHEHFNVSQKKQYAYRSVRVIARQLSSLAGMLVMFTYGAYLNRMGSLTVGEFVAFVMYYQMMNQQSAQIVSILVDQSLLLHQGEKIKEFMELEPDVKEPESPVLLRKVRGELSFRNVHFSYGSRDILHGFDLQVRAGERIALVGPSGNGKSTILKLIGRFYDPCDGELALDGVPLKQLPLSQIRDSIGYVFQETYLFGASIRENIRFGYPDASEEQVVEAAKAANAHEFIMKLKDGYDTLVGERGVKLSGGQRQRLSIARMFIKNPKIILLDEATSALDNVSEIEVLKALDNLMQGRTTVTVAHRISTVRHYDRIVVVKDGIAAEEGSYQELLGGRGWLYELEGRMLTGG